ncbi:LysR family transcriptional regulator [Pseudomonas typographi]|uniref:LysR family transcriptional regulator n=1 Tax=Pseudomonas typographi TaxID=2715964 RepID=A0ABR7YX48_9PSED|nr:LysR family transcriptional regulator [Pseudomonas typographi]MBD1551264.1 LysR family transcriptional regulator [Pseudomonas typographi]MBD1597714.1 LysR family transcriptional regulator [Pseudomonas typographi]
MDLRQLRYYLALTEHRSFGRAAQAMGITQPAFSRSIQNLEQALGCALVDRSDRNLRPTPQGEILVQHARRLLQGVTEMASEIGGMSALDAGLVRVGIEANVALPLLAAAITRLHQRYPGLEVQWSLMDSQEAGAALARQSVDLLLADSRPFEADPALHIQPLTPQPAVFFCRPQHPLRARDLAEAAALVCYPLASSRAQPALRKGLASLAGRADYRVHFEGEDFNTLLELVLASDAIGVAAKPLCDLPLATGKVATLRFRDLPPALAALHYRGGIIVREGYRLGAPARAFIDSVVAVDKHPA